jgi:alkylation response protein AidB-like acyl-CoA dehydrogenase
MTAALVPDPTEEQAMLVAASARFTEDQVPLAAVRARADGAALDDAAYRRTAAELGWFGLLADESRGGGSASGRPLLDAALIADLRGAHLQPGPFPGHSSVVHALSAVGGDAHTDLLEQLVSGTTWATFAFSARPTVELRADGDGLRLVGVVGPIAELDLCGVVLVPASSTDGPALVSVRTDGPGVERRPLEGLDVTRCWGTLVLDAPVGRDALVGAPGREAADLAADQTRVAAVLTAAEAVGTMGADLGQAVEYAKDRIAFGRPIGSFQALKHLLADASLATEMALGLVHAAAVAVGDRAPEGPELAHAAKAFVAERGVAIAHDCFQVFGGIGYTWEHDQHLHLRRLFADAESFGSAAWHRGQLLDAAGAPR